MARLHFLIAFAVVAAIAAYSAQAAPSNTVRELISNPETIALVDSIARALNVDVGGLLEADGAKDRRKRSLDDLIANVIPELLTAVNIAVKSIINTVLLQMNSLTDGIFNDALININAVLSGLVDKLIPAIGS